MMGQNTGVENDNDEKQDNRAFCFCLGELVDCLPGVVLDCNNKRTRKCPLLTEENPLEEENKKLEPHNPDQKDNRAFCFCMGEQVDCLPGVVLDCNNKRTRKCPLLKEEEGEREKGRKQDSEEHKIKEKKDNRAFCFCMGAQVDCLPGVVLDCNNKRTTECPLVKEVLVVNKDKEKQVTKLKNKYKKNVKNNRKQDNRPFCFYMGSQVDCLPGVVLDCNNKRTTECPLVKEVLIENIEEEKKVKELKDKYKKVKNKDDRPFCFCKGEQVDCLPGVVLDCNNKRTTECPLTKKDSEENKKKDHQENTIKSKPSKNKKKSKKKDDRPFCFCMGEQVDCLPGVVLDCNNKRTRICPLEKE
ncbi:MAG: hypothetical protein HFI75_08490 [Lachnospiraceae bacterium]|nr:hypothetical protein [Lachnospiraceae bacterium]